MKIPKTVNINGIPFSVQLVPSHDLDNDTVGLINYSKQAITIHQKGKEYTQITFLHEVVHGMMHFLGIVEHDEALVDGLASQLYMVIKDNKELFEEKDN